MAVFPLKIFSIFVLYFWVLLSVYSCFLLKRCNNLPKMFPNGSSVNLSINSQHWKLRESWDCSFEGGSSLKKIIGFGELSRLKSRNWTVSLLTKMQLSPQIEQYSMSRENHESESFALLRGVSTLKNIIELCDCLDSKVAIGLWQLLLLPPKCTNCEFFNEPWKSCIRKLNL